MDYSVLEGLVDESQPVPQAEGKGSKAEKRLQRQAQRSAEREQSQRQPAQAAPAEVTNPRSVKPGKGSAASFLLPPSDVPADKAGAFVEQLVLERQAREARQAEARLMARGSRDGQHQQPQQQQQQGQHIYHQHRILPCHHYQRGHCSYGDSCHYSHDVPQLPAASSMPGGAAGGSDHTGHTRPGSAGSSASGGGGSSGRVRADGLTQEQLSGVRGSLGANTQDPLLTREALARLGKRPDDMPFYKTVMCNFWKHQGFCPRGDSCTYAHGEADKRPQYSGSDVRRKDPRPAHYQQQLQPQPQQQQQPPRASAPAADPADLMRQVAAAYGRTAAGAGGGQQRPRPYRPYSPQMGSTSNAQQGPTQSRPPPPPPHQQPAIPWQQEQQQQQQQQPPQEADVPAAFQLPASHTRGSSAPQQRPQPPPPKPSAPRPASAQQSKGRQQHPSPQQQRQQPRQSQAQHLHKQIGQRQQSGFAQQSAFGLLATSDDDKSDAGSGAGSEDGNAAGAAPAVAAGAQVPAQNGQISKTGLANVMAELNIDSDEDLDEEVLGSFFCPVTQELLKDPVVAADGHTYEREVIERWLEKSTTSPLTGLELPHRTLMENTAVKCAIAATMKQRQARKG